MQNFASQTSKIPHQVSFLCVILIFHLPNVLRMALISELFKILFKDCILLWRLLQRVHLILGLKCKLRKQRIFWNIWEYLLETSTFRLQIHRRLWWLWSFKASMMNVFAHQLDIRHAIIQLMQFLLDGYQVGIYSFKCQSAVWQPC